jgi:NAD(P)-dependent dehydrogenase (short-subunit alcohol dehydrogenase family)
MSEPRNAVITGASRGLGFASAVHPLQRRGLSPGRISNNMGGRARRIEDRCDTVPVMFWQTGLTMRTK